MFDRIEKSAFAFFASSARFRVLTAPGVPGARGACGMIALRCCILSPPFAFVFIKIRRLPAFDAFLFLCPFPGALAALRFPKGALTFQAPHYIRGAIAIFSGCNNYFWQFL